MSWDPVFRFVQQIPRGRVLTYGALAKALRLPGGARSAGRAMAATPSGKGIPWHRVVGERGKILIREPYASLQRKLLASEGIAILESRVDLKRHLWKPPKKSATIATRQHVDKRLDVVLLSPLSAQLLKLCDGERTVSEIASRFVSPGRAISSIPADKVCVFGLEVLRQQGLIALHHDPSISA